MRRIFNRKFERYMYEIFAGGYFVTKEKEVVLATLLGSCVSVCLKDPAAGVAGINHFMLPGRVNVKKKSFSDDARYGVNAMEIMINEMMKLGANRSCLQAKVFGGGRVMDTALCNVASSNIDFALAYLEAEGIPVLASDVGGEGGRKVFFFPDSFDVLLKRIPYRRLQDAVWQEKRLLQESRRNKKEESELVIFA